jgi:hypothetical protein
MEVERQHSGNVGRVVSSVRWLLSGQNYHLFLLLLKICALFWWMKKNKKISMRLITSVYGQDINKQKYTKMRGVKDTITMV